MAKTLLPKISIIGAGNVGSAIGAALFEKGYSVASVISRSGRSAIGLAKALKCKRASTEIQDVAPESQIILITASDGSIEQVALELSKNKKLRFRKLFVVHTSGVRSSDALHPLKKKGASVASVHPIQTFPNGQSVSYLRSKLKGIYYGIDGDDSAIKLAEALVKDLEGRSIVVPTKLKPLYHAACVFSSSYLMVLMNAISELSSHLKLKASWTEVFGPLMTTSMENTIKHSASEALTGPILRGDLATIGAHLKALAGHAPQFLPLYTTGGLEIARIAKSNGKIQQEQYDELLSHFKKFIRTASFNNKPKVKR